MNKSNNVRHNKCKNPSGNGAVSRNCGNIPQKIKCDFERMYPARKSVIAATAGEAAGTLGASDGQQHRKRLKPIRATVLKE